MHHFLLLALLRVFIPPSSNAHAQAGNDACCDTDVRPNAVSVQCLKLSKTTFSGLIGHLVIIINLSAQVSASLSFLSLYHFASHSSRYPLFSASVLDACNHCVGSFLVHHLAPPQMVLADFHSRLY